VRNVQTTKAGLGRQENGYRFTTRQQPGATDPQIGAVSLNLIRLVNEQSTINSQQSTSQSALNNLSRRSGRRRLSI
jgi:hypothetical protein